MNGKFIRIDMSLFCDDTLNNNERIILSYINGFPDGYYSTLTRIAENLGQTRKTVSKAVNNLIKNGYLYKEDDTYYVSNNVTQTGKNVTSDEDDGGVEFTHDTSKSYTSGCNENTRPTGKSVTQSVTELPTYNIREENYNVDDNKSINKNNKKNYLFDDSFDKTNTRRNTKRHAQKKNDARPDFFDVIHYFIENKLGNEVVHFMMYYDEHGWSKNGKPIDWRKKAKEFALGNTSDG